MKLLITGAWKHNEVQIKRMNSLGYEVIELLDEKEDVPCSDFDGIVCNGFFLYHDIENYKNLKYIQLTSAGYDRVPMDYIMENDISIYNAKGTYSIPMSEYAVSKILDIYQDSFSFFQKQKEHEWDKNRNLRELYGKTVCIIGCGNVGTECGKRFSAFGCKVIGIDNHVTDWFDGIVSLDDGLQMADIVILALPLTEETSGIINISRIMKVKNNAIIVNFSRGAIITREALLCRNDVKFVLDVFEQEPLSKEDEIWDRDNVIITPHNSFIGEGNERRLEDLIFKNLEAHKW